MPTVPRQRRPSADHSLSDNPLPIPSPLLVRGTVRPPRATSGPLAWPPGIRHSPYKIPAYYIDGSAEYADLHGIGVAPSNRRGLSLATLR
jgi:hypothetical protein